MEQAKPAIRGLLFPAKRGAQKFLSVPLARTQPKCSIHFALLSLCLAPTHSHSIPQLHCCVRRSCKQKLFYWVSGIRSIFQEV